MEKRCTKCGLVKGPTGFAKNKSKPDGYQSWCRACFSRHNQQRQYSAEYYRMLKANDPAKLQEQQRQARFKYRYGITEHDYNRMVAEQNNCCLICGRDPGYPLYIDHCHDTGEVRGLLCSKCNGALGWLANNRDRIATYLGWSEWLTPEDSTQTSSVV